MAYCRTCGNELSVSSRFCDVCGTEVSSESINPLPIKKIALNRIIVGIALIIIGIVCYNHSFSVYEEAQYLWNHSKTLWDLGKQRDLTLYGFLYEYGGAFAVFMGLIFSITGLFKR